MRKKIYDSAKERQKAYRERKKKAGYKRIVIDVPESLYPFIKGKPATLVAAFIEYAKEKGLYVEFNQVSFVGYKHARENHVLLKNDEGCQLKVTNIEQIKLIEKADRAVKRLKGVRLYPDGTLEILS